MHKLLKKQDIQESCGFQTMGCIACELCLEGFERNIYLSLTGGCWGKNLQGVVKNMPVLNICAVDLECSHLARALLILLVLHDLNVPDSAR